MSDGMGPVKVKGCIVQNVLEDVGQTMGKGFRRGVRVGLCPLALPPRN